MKSTNGCVEISVHGKRKSKILFIIKFQKKLFVRILLQKAISSIFSKQIQSTCRSEEMIPTYLHKYKEAVHHIFNCTTFFKQKQITFSRKILGFYESLNRV